MRNKHDSVVTELKDYLSAFDFVGNRKTAHPVMGRIDARVIKTEAMTLLDEILSGKVRRTISSVPHKNADASIDPSRLCPKTRLPHYVRNLLSYLPQQTGDSYGKNTPSLVSFHPLELLAKGQFWWPCRLVCRVVRKYSQRHVPQIFIALLDIADAVEGGMPL